jgi:DNA-binding CsgD family transcriptional regulator
MGGSDFLGRWIDLTADLLARPVGDDPMSAICDELAARYCAPATGTVDYSDARARLGLYHVELDARPYAPHVGDHPLALHFRQTHDPHVADLADARRFLRNERSQAILHHLRVENLRDFVVMPLQARRGTDHRWLGLSSDHLGSSVRSELERLRPLVRAIDAHSAALASGLPRPLSDVPASHPDLSSRELAVLALIAEGLTAIAIGYRLRISPRTVSKHQQNLYRKLDVRDRLSAVVRAQDVGLVLSQNVPRSSHAVTFIDAEVAAHPVRIEEPIEPPVRRAGDGMNRRRRLRSSAH